MTSDRFLNAYHNASTAPSSDLPADLASFMLAVDPVLADAAELARSWLERTREPRRS